MEVDDSGRGSPNIFEAIENIYAVNLDSFFFLKKQLFIVLV